MLENVKNIHEAVPVESSAGIAALHKKVDLLMSRDEWRPMETAPMNATTVMLFIPAYKLQPIRIGCYRRTEIIRDGISTLYERWVVDGIVWEAADYPIPSHWMPLPEIPR